MERDTIPRNMPGFPSGNLEKPDPHPDTITKTCTIEVITPLFGGGYEAGNVDPDLPIRPSSIRGHLRFWWRATRGAKYDTVEKLRQREGEIWGTTENPSPVGIDVTNVSCTGSVPCATYDWNQNRRHGDGGYDLNWTYPLNNRRTPLPYALFPFQGAAPGTQKPRDPSEMIASLQFQLVLKIPNSSRMKQYQDVYNEQREKKKLDPVIDAENDIKNDVEAALWAWLNFGGVGARTRRGCGALYCLEMDPPDQNIIPENFETFDSWLENCIARYDLTFESREWPTLGKILCKQGEDPISCWEACVLVMKDFRQGGNVGRDPGHGPHLGRSRWPEPESLRKTIMRQRGFHTRQGGWHPEDPRMAGHVAFPRAEFGMPIIFEIRGEGIKPTLKPDGDHDRMASPLLLRPLKFKNGCTSVIVRLRTPPLDSAYLKPGERPDPRDLHSGITVPASQITDQGNTTYNDSPLSGFCTTGSALDAFITYAINKHHFHEVKP